MENFVNFSADCRYNEETQRRLKNIGLRMMSLEGRFCKNNGQYYKL